MRGAFPHAREAVIKDFVPGVREGGVSARESGRKWTVYDQMTIYDSIYLIYFI